MNKIIVAIWFFFCTQAFAVTTHFCDCGTGAAVGCVAGASGNAGTAASPKQTLANFSTAFASAAAGDQLLFCQGGAWDSWNFESVPTTSSLAAYVANPLVISSYSSPNFSSTAKPILNVAASGNGFSFRQNAGTRRGGVRISGLKLDGGFRGGNVGFNANWNVQNIVFENSTVTQMQQWGGCGSAFGFGYASHITFRNLDLSYSTGMGIGTSGGCEYVVIENNTLNYGAMGSMTQASKIFDHPLYVTGRDYSGDTLPAYGTVIRNNLITNSGTGMTDAGGTNKCGTSIIVGHDRISDWVIENNIIVQANGEQTGFCYGIDYAPGNGNYEYEQRLKIRGNLIVNPGGNAIRIGHCQDCEISLNKIVYEYNVEARGINAENNGGTGPVMANTRILSNSIYFFGNSDISTAIHYEAPTGSGNAMVGNLIYFGAGSASGRRCMLTAGATALWAEWDYNFCFGFQEWADVGGTGYATKAAFTSARSGHDTNGSSANPLLTAIPSSGNGYAMSLQSGSPAVNACASARCARLAYAGRRATAARDVGAEERP